MAFFSRPSLSKADRREYPPYSRQTTRILYPRQRHRIRERSGEPHIGIASSDGGNGDEDFNCQGQSTSVNSVNIYFRAAKVFQR